MLSWCLYNTLFCLISLDKNLKIVVNGEILYSCLKKNSFLLILYIFRVTTLWANFHITAVAKLVCICPTIFYLVSDFCYSWLFLWDDLLSMNHLFVYSWSLAVVWWRWHCVLRETAMEAIANIYTIYSKKLLATDQKVFLDLGNSIRHQNTQDTAYSQDEWFIRI